MTVNIIKINEKGHLAVAESCQWYLHHHVNNQYCVSSMGEWKSGRRYVAETNSVVDDPDHIEELGYSETGNCYYETCIFPITGPCNVSPLECNCPHGSTKELYCRRFETSEDTTKNHMKLVEALSDGVTTPDDL